MGWLAQALMLLSFLLHVTREYQRTCLLWDFPCCVCVWIEFVDLTLDSFIDEKSFKCVLTCEC